MGVNWIHGSNFGTKLTDDVPCVLGKEIKPEDSLHFFFKAAVYEDFTITDDGVSGNEITKGQSSIYLWGYKFNNNSVYTYPFPSNFAFYDTSVRAYRVAGVMHMSGASPYEVPYLTIILQNADDSGGGYFNLIMLALTNYLQITLVMMLALWLKLVIFNILNVVLIFLFLIQKHMQKRIYRTILTRLTREFLMHHLLIMRKSICWTKNFILSTIHSLIIIVVLQLNIGETTDSSLDMIAR